MLYQHGMPANRKNLIPGIRYQDFFAGPDLRIGDYLTDVEFRPDLSYAEILRMAIKREEHSVKLYNDLKEPQGDPKLNQLSPFWCRKRKERKKFLKN
jgi:rubrerythrin